MHTCQTVRYAAWKHYREDLPIEPNAWEYIRWSRLIGNEHYMSKHILWSCSSRVFPGGHLLSLVMRACNQKLQIWAYSSYELRTGIKMSNLKGAQLVRKRCHSLYINFDVVLMTRQRCAILLMNQKYSSLRCMKYPWINSNKRRIIIYCRICRPNTSKGLKEKESLKLCQRGIYHSSWLTRYAV